MVCATCSQRSVCNRCLCLYNYSVSVCMPLYLCELVNIGCERMEQVEALIWEVSTPISRHPLQPWDLGSCPGLSHITNKVKETQVLLSSLINLPLTNTLMPTNGAAGIALHVGFALNFAYWATNRLPMIVAGASIGQKTKKTKTMQI